jgi:DedD protein
MAEPADINVDELRRRARRRLVGAIVLALGVAVVVPMLLETEPKPLGDDVSVNIPPVDAGKFVNRLNDSPAKDAANAKPVVIDDMAKGSPPASGGPADVTARSQKYDTRLPDNATSSSSLPPVAQSPVQEAAVPGAAPRAPAPPEASTAETAPAVPSRPSQTSVGSKESARPATATVHAPVNVARASAMHEGYAVQLAAFSDDKGANSLAGRLKKAGYTAYTEPLKTSKGTLWRVRVGPYPSREAAVAVRDKLKTEGQAGIVAAIK